MRPNLLCKLHTALLSKISTFNVDFSLNPLATLCLIIQRILAREHVKFGLLKFKILS